MAIPTNTIIIIVAVCGSVGLAIWIFMCFGGGVWIRRCFNCTTVEDEEAQERRDANRRNRALATRLGDGTFVPRDQATTGNQIYNPWAAQSMVPEQAQPMLYPKADSEQDAHASHQPGTYKPGRGYPYPVGWVPPTVATPAPIPLSRTPSPPPVYFPNNRGGPHPAMESRR